VVPMLGRKRTSDNSQKSKCCVLPGNEMTSGCAVRAHVRHFAGIGDNGNNGNNGNKTKDGRCTGICTIDAPLRAPERVRVAGGLRRRMRRLTGPTRLQSGRRPRARETDPGEVAEHKNCFRIKSAVADIATRRATDPDACAQDVRVTRPRTHEASATLRSERAAVLRSGALGRNCHCGRKCRRQTQGDNSIPFKCLEPPHGICYLWRAWVVNRDHDASGR